MLAKLTPPSVAAALPRSRLFPLLEPGAEDRNIVWIEAPAGYGKTMLVASYVAARRLPCIWYGLDAGDADVANFFHYLSRAAPGLRRPRWAPTPELMSGIETFARRCFEQLAERLTRPAVLVFDNYESLPADCLLHRVLASGLDALPPGVAAAILGRTAIPPEFARLRASRRVRRVGPHQLRLTPEEAHQVARLAHGGPSVTRELTDALHARTQGWAAGLILLLEHFHRRSRLPDVVIDGPAVEPIFDYFAGELFDDAGPELQSFLLRTAFLPEMTGAIAAELARHPDAEATLAGLRRANLFILCRDDGSPVYEFHPLFRQFLQARARQALGHEDLRQLQGDTARVLAGQQRIAEALELLAECRDWSGLADLLRDQAADLLAQGRHGSLQRWLTALPPERLELDPWLLYWRGSSRVLRQPPAARADLVRAFARFGERADRAGQVSAWTQIVESFLLERHELAELDGWIAEWPRIAPAGEDLPPPVAGRAIAALFGALAHRQPMHPELPRWESQVLALMQALPDADAQVTIGAHLANYYHWMGDLPKARLVTEVIRAAARGAEALSPMGRILHQVVEAILAWFSHEPQAALNATDEGLRLAEASGVHALDHVLAAQGVYANLGGGEIEAARGCLQRLAPVLGAGHAMETAHYHLLAAFIELAAGATSPAIAHGEACCAAGERAGTPFPVAIGRLAQVLALTQHGELSRADEALERTRRDGLAMGSRLLAFECALARADLERVRGRPPAVLAALAEAMRVGRGGGLLLSPWWPLDAKARLCRLALEHDVERDYVRHLVRTHGLDGDAATAPGEHWPWAVRVHAMGRFELQVEGQTLHGRRLPPRPLALLKCLVALGGTEVPQERVADVLWPDSDGDGAAAALKTTLARLRRLIGRETLRLEHQRLTLDPRRCWVDALALDRLLAPTGRPDPPSTPQRILALYRGPFLADEDEPWALSLRERLRARTLAAVTEHARTEQRHGRFDEAIALYQRCVQLDPLAAEAYQRLLSCYLAQGRTAEARVAYRECEEAFKRLAGGEPPPETGRALREAALPRRPGGPHG